MEPEILKEARRRVDEKSKFYKHLFFYLAFNVFFLIVGIFKGRPFVSFPVILFWGLGVLFHYLRVFGIPGTGILSEEWKEREIKKEMNRLQSQRGMPSKEEELKLKELRKNYDESELV